ncbi:MAG: hypothetical protein RL012_466 [Bacteroidota bacterium]|jgi:UPF0755 protein
MQKRNLIRIASVAGSALLIVHLLLVYGLFMRPNILVEKPGKQLEIPHGMGFKALKKTLQQHGYVANLASFNLVARLVRYDRKIMPGAYQLETNMSTWKAIQVLKTGAQKPVKIVLHHVRTKEELAAKITQNIEINAADFKKLLDDSAFVSQYGFNPDNVMTMFIPNTYEVYWTITAEGLFSRMHKEYQRFWNTNRRSQAKYLKLTPIDVAILASIVQSETNKIEEAPLIAGVYINRLRKKVALQSCPTLLYALGDPSLRRVLHKYKDLDSPYNTYNYGGLPPGPISLPTIAMIDAVLNSTSSDYLYFSAKEDFSGYHYFTRSFKEHLRNAKRYQRALNQARIYR